MDGLSKEKYIEVVKFTLNSMIELSKTDENYDLLLDTVHYYDKIIKAEGVLTREEFVDLCKEAGIKW